MRCPACRSNKITKSGRKWSHGKRVQQYRCTNCGRSTIYPKEG